MSITAQKISIDFRDTNLTNFFSFSKRVLQVTSGIHDLGNMQWELLGCLLGGWILVYLIIRRGIHQSGKVNISPSPFPFLPLPA